VAEHILARVEEEDFQSLKGIAVGGVQEIFRTHLARSKHLLPEYPDFFTTQAAQCGITFLAAIKSICTRNFGDWIKWKTGNSIQLQFPKIRRKVLSRLVDYICHRIIGPKGPLYSAREQPDEDEDEDDGETETDVYTVGVNDSYSWGAFIDFLREKFKVRRGVTKEVCL
jgi:hypothetical protein